MLTQRSGELMIFSEHMVQIHEFLQPIQKILSGISWLSFKMRGNHQSMDHKQINWSGEGFGIMFPRNLVQDVGSRPSRKVFQEFIQIRKSSLHRPKKQLDHKFNVDIIWCSLIFSCLPNNQTNGFRKSTARRG